MPSRCGQRRTMPNDIHVVTDWDRENPRRRLPCQTKGANVNDTRNVARLAPSRIHPINERHGPCCTVPSEI